MAEKALEVAKRICQGVGPPGYTFSPWAFEQVAKEIEATDPDVVDDSS